MHLNPQQLTSSSLIKYQQIKSKTSTKKQHLHTTHVQQKSSLKVEMIDQQHPRSPFFELWWKLFIFFVVLGTLVGDPRVSELSILLDAITIAYLLTCWFTFVKAMWKGLYKFVTELWVAVGILPPPPPPPPSTNSTYAANAANAAQSVTVPPHASDDDTTNPPTDTMQKKTYIIPLNNVAQERVLEVSFCSGGRCCCEKKDLNELKKTVKEFGRELSGTEA